MDKVRIEINRSTRDAIKEVGNMGDTYDILLCKMIDIYKPYTVHMAKLAAERAEQDNGAP